MKIIRENSTFRLIWDSVIVILIFTTFALLPFQLAFNQDLFMEDQGIIYFLDTFFWLDIFFNFFTSYRHHGEEVTSPSQIKTHYFKKFFLADLIPNIPFHLISLIFPPISIGKIPLFSIVSLLRLLRLVRLLIIFHRWESYSHLNPGYIRIIKLFLTVITLTHWIACFWFFLAFMDGFPANSWVTIHNLQNAPISIQYIRSLYWAVTTMTTIGYGDITPHREKEYIATIFIMFVGASSYAFLIGNIASVFSNLDSAKIEHKNKIDALTQFLTYHNVPKPLIFKLKNYYDYIWERHRGLPENNFFNDLPLHFHLDILQYITGDLLDRVALFKYCSPRLKNVLLMALKFQTYPPNSYVVKEGDLGEAIYFLSLGKVEVFSEQETDFQCILETGEYFGHLSLAFNEKLTASAKTLTYCEIFILNKEQFNYIKNEYAEFKEVLEKSGLENSEKMSQLILQGLIL